jgi:hypothetical protein
MRRVGLYGSSAKNNPTTTERIVMTTRKTRTTKQNEEISIAFAFAEYDAHKRRVRDQREKRDRELATSVGIEIGTLREADRCKARENKIWDRGFIVGVLVAVACILIGLYSASLAEGATRPAPRAEDHAAKVLPPHWRQWLDTCHAEQPRPGTYAGRGSFKNIWWHQTTNYTYKGGCGFTQENWDAHKRKGQPRYMSDASPLEQLWACERIYQHYAKIGGAAYGASVWDANDTIGFYGFAPVKATR